MATTEMQNECDCTWPGDIHHRSCWAKLPYGDIGENDGSERWQRRLEWLQGHTHDKNSELLIEMCREVFPGLVWRSERNGDVWRCWGRCSDDGDDSRMVEFAMDGDDLTYTAYKKAASAWIRVMSNAPKAEQGIHVQGNHFVDAGGNRVDPLTMMQGE